MQNTKLFFKAVKYKVRSMIEQKSVPINWHKSFILYPFKLFFHPIDTFNDLKYEGKSSMIIANVLAVLFFVVKLLQQTTTSYLFMPSGGENVSIWTVFAISVGLLIVFTVCNWATSTLVDGEGSMGDIWIAVTYSLLPSILFTALNIVLSYFFTVTESTFYNFFTVFGTTWTILLVFLGLMVMHQYTVTKTVFSVFATLVIILCFVFLILLFMSIYQQIYSFVVNIVREIIIRQL